MNKVAIVYWSGTGNTEQMAQAVAEGVKNAGGEADVLTCAEFDSAKLADYGAVAFGCPAMGAEQLEEGEFEPMFNDCRAKLSGKKFADLEGSLSGVKVALFGSYGWGSGQWLEDWCARCKEDGAVMQEEPGVMANEAPDDDAIAACNALGAKLAAC